MFNLAPIKNFPGGCKVTLIRCHGTSGLSILLHGVISLLEATSYDKVLLSLI